MRNLLDYFDEPYYGDVFGSAADSFGGQMPVRAGPLTGGLSMGAPEQMPMTVGQPGQADPYAQIRSMPASYFQEVQRQMNGDNVGGERMRGGGAPADYAPQYETGYQIDEAALRANPALASYQSKFNSLSKNPDGSFSAVLQDPGRDKYDLLNATYKLDPATGKYSLQGDPSRYRQQSGLTEGLQALGTVATPFAAALAGPALAASLGGGALGGAGAGALIGGGGALASGGNSQDALRSAAMGGIGGAASGYFGGPADLPSGMDLAADAGANGANSIRSAAAQFGSGPQAFNLPPGYTDPISTAGADQALSRQMPTLNSDTSGGMSSAWQSPTYGDLSQLDPSVLTGGNPLAPAPGALTMPGAPAYGVQMPAMPAPPQAPGSSPPSGPASATPPDTQSSFRPSDNYGDGMSGRQTGAFDGTLNATGSTGLASAAAGAAGAVDGLQGLLGPAANWIGANPQLARTIFSGLGGLLGYLGADGGSGSGGGAPAYSGPVQQWTSGLQMGIQPDASRPQMAIPSAIRPRTNNGAGRFFNGG